MNTSGMDTLTDHRRLLAASIAILSAGAWLALSMSTSTDGSTHVHHHAGAAAGAPPLVSMLFFVGSWTVMTIAMMLPTSLPVLTTFHTIAGERDDRTLLVALVVAGYLVTWAAFGASVHVAQLGLQQLALASRWLGEHAWITGGGILMIAGLYQFTPLKHRCLEKCRSPLSFVIEHWRGRDERQQAFQLGVHHGLFCVGCCWALMLLMFVVGTTDGAWMLVLAVVMAIEKNTRWGRRLGAPLGTALLGWGIVTLVGN